MKTNHFLIVLLLFISINGINAQNNKRVVNRFESIDTIRSSSEIDRINQFHNLQQQIDTLLIHSTIRKRQLIIEGVDNQADNNRFLIKDIITDTAIISRNKMISIKKK